MRQNSISNEQNALFPLRTMFSMVDFENIKIFKMGKLKCSYDYTDNGNNDPNSLKFGSFSFKNMIAKVMVTIDKAEAIGVINIASPMVNP